MLDKILNSQIHAISTVPSDRLLTNVKGLNQEQRSIALKAIQQLEAKNYTEVPLADKVIADLTGPSTSIPVSNSFLGTLAKTITSFCKGLGNLLGLRISSAEIIGEINKLNQSKKIEIESKYERLVLLKDFYQKMNGKDEIAVLHALFAEPVFKEEASELLSLFANRTEFSLTVSPRLELYKIEVNIAKETLLRDVYQSVLVQMKNGRANWEIVQDLIAWADKFKLKHEIEQLLEDLVLHRANVAEYCAAQDKKLTLLLSQNLPSFGHVYGKGEVSSQVRVTYINGINTSVSGMERALHSISSSHGDVNVHYVFSPPDGIPKDFYRALLNLRGKETPEVDQLVVLWRRLLNDMGGTSNPKNRIIHYGYSRGALITKRALEKLTPEERRLISVRTIGSPEPIRRADTPRVKNYVGAADKTSLISPLSLFKSYRAGEVVFVPTKAKIFEHSILKDGYQRHLKKLGSKFIRKYINSAESA